MEYRAWLAVAAARRNERRRNKTRQRMCWFCFVVRVAVHLLLVSWSLDPSIVNNSLQVLEYSWYLKFLKVQLRLDGSLVHMLGADQNDQNDQNNSKQCEQSFHLSSLTVPDWRQNSIWMFQSQTGIDFADLRCESLRNSICPADLRSPLTTSGSDLKEQGEQASKMFTGAFRQAQSRIDLTCLMCGNLSPAVLSFPPINLVPKRIQQDDQDGRFRS